MVLIEVTNTEVVTKNPITQSSLRIFTFPFTVPVDSDQKIDFARVFAQIDILDGAGTSLATRILFNGRDVGSNIWAQSLIGDYPTFIVDQMVSLAGVKVNETNEITIMVEQKFSPFFQNARFKIFSDFFYSVVNKSTGQEEIPSVPPVLEDVEVIEVPAPPDDNGIFGFNFSDFLFGDLEKTIRTVAVIGVVIVGVIIIPPVARSITATQKLRTKTSKTAV